MKKRILSVLLALVTLLTNVSLFQANAAAAEEPKYEPDVPYIHINGLMTSDIYADPDDPDSDTVWPPSTGNIVKGVLKLLPALGILKITKNYDKFSGRFTSAVNTVLAPAQLDAAGEVPDSSGARMEYPPESEITASSFLWFDYDWRVDPVVTADKLKDFIDYVLKASGCDKVILESHSFGGVVLLSYCGKYGTDKVKSVIFNASAAAGETFTGDLCQGKFELSADALTEYLKGAFSFTDGEKFLNKLFAFLNKTGFTGKLCDDLNKIFTECHDDIYAEVLYPLFGNWPSIWSMVPDEMYDDTVKAVFDGFYKNDGVDHSGMRAKVESFHNNYRVNRTAILNNINDTANLYIVCRYGYCSLFCTPSWRIANDMIIDVSKASFGATAAPYGEALSDGYLKDKAPEYISPSKNIDASTCLFPEQTWFISDYMHMKSKPDDMFETLAYCKTQATVNTFEQYPRFMKYLGDGKVAADK